jgi:hypothetical protein
MRRVPSSTIPHGSARPPGSEDKDNRIESFGHVRKVRLVGTNVFWFIASFRSSHSLNGPYNPPDKLESCVDDY